MNTKVRKSFAKIGLGLSYIFVMVLLSVAPAFATTSNQALQSITATVQEAVSNQTLPGNEIVFMHGAVNVGGAIDSDGRLWMWGTNGDGGTGLGTTTGMTGTPHLIPVRPPATAWTQVHTSETISAAMDNAGQIFTWGRMTNAHHALGIDVSGPGVMSTPQHVAVPAPAAQWTQMNFARNTVGAAIDNTGRLFMWGGSPGNGARLGNGSTAAQNVPTEVPLQGSATAWVEVVTVGSTAGHTLARDNTGALYAWGWGSSGRLGQGNNFDSSNPLIVPLQGSATSWDYIFASEDGQSFAIDNTGRLFAWGGNHLGQLGIGSTSVSADTPQEVPLQGSATAWIYVHTYGTNVVYAIDNAGRMFAWGDNWHGRLGADIAAGGSSGAVTVNAPHEVPLQGSATAWVQVNATRNISVGALDDTGNLFTWGWNPDGNLGIGNTAAQNSPQLVAVPEGATGWDQIFVGSRWMQGIDDVGRLFSWGGNTGSRLGLGAPGNHDVPQLVHVRVASVFPVHDSVVPVTTDELVIHWNRPLVNPYNRLLNADSITIAGGTSAVTVNLADGVISNGPNGSRTVFTIPLVLTSPAIELEPGTTYTVTLTGFSGHDDGFPAEPWVTPYVWVFHTEGESPVLPMQDTLTKTLRLPANTTIPTLAFDFTFTPVQVTMSENPTISSVAAASVPAISTQTISFSNTSTYTESSGIRTSSQSISLSNLVNALTFPHAGTFVWNIEEVQTTPTVTSPSHLDFSQARYEMRVLVDRYLEVRAIELFVRVVDTNTQTVGTKVPIALFTNTYTSATTLSVQKVVTGSFANENLDFNFTLTLTNPTLGGTIGNITANVVDINTPNTTLRTVPITVGTNTFVLSHNERLVIPNLPTGTTFSITEAAATEYTASAVITIGGTVQGTPPTYQNPLPNTALTTGTYTIATSGTNSANFTNAHQFTPPTGLNVANAPYILGVLAVVALVLLAATRKRKTIESLPIV